MNWYERLKDLCEKRLFSIERLNNAVEKGLITEEEKLEIIKLVNE
jgi:hypothetical protein